MIENLSCHCYDLFSGVHDRIVWREMEKIPAVQRRHRKSKICWHTCWQDNFKDTFLTREFPEETLCVLLPQKREHCVSGKKIPLFVQSQGYIQGYQLKPFSHLTDPSALSFPPPNLCYFLSRARRKAASEAAYLSLCCCHRHCHRPTGGELICLF